MQVFAVLGDKSQRPNSLKLSAWLSLFFRHGWAGIKRLAEEWIFFQHNLRSNNCLNSLV